ncbi:hypothetical protein, partial [Endozoicomonas ascidiicola]|uniref:hypothetical protein n=1 Tax=Endozoicomonas ascidiicola TaxID=1698521 RepID=UPI001C12A3A1
LPTRLYLRCSLKQLLHLLERFDEPCVHYDFHPVILDERSEITGSFHFGNKGSVQAHFILEETYYRFLVKLELDCQRNRNVHEM